MSDTMNSISEFDFEDEESKLLFQEMKEYADNNNKSWRLKSVLRRHNIWMRKLADLHSNITDKISRGNVYIFGAGAFGQRLYNSLVRYSLNNNIVGFFDNDTNKQKSVLNGIIIQNPTLTNGNVLIPDCSYAWEVYYQLYDLGYSKEQLIVVPNTYEEIKDWQELPLEEIFMNKNNHFIVFGRGSYCEILRLLQYEKVNLDFEIVEDGLNSLELLSNSDNCYFIVFTDSHRQMLIEKRISKERIIHFVSTDGYLQYFDPTVIPKHIIGRKEIFIDGGSLDLKVSEEFLIWCQGEAKRIIAFEPDHNSYRNCQNRLSVIPSLANVCNVRKSGLYKKKDILHFDIKDVFHGASSHFVDVMYDQEGEKRIDTVFSENYSEKIVEMPTESIDEVLMGDEVTFIKLDVEGAELDALQGAVNSIKKWHPILAVSVYHKPEDVLEIPAFIKSVFPDYKFYLRPYHEDHIEIVLYAIPNEMR